MLGSIKNIQKSTFVRKSSFNHTPNPVPKKTLLSSFKQQAATTVFDNVSSKQANNQFFIIEDKHTLANLVFNEDFNHGIGPNETIGQAKTKPEKVSENIDLSFDGLNKLIKDENETFNYLRSITANENYFQTFVSNLDLNSYKRFYSNLEQLLDEVVVTIKLARKLKTICSAAPELTNTNSIDMIPQAEYPVQTSIMVGRNKMKQVLKQNLKHSKFSLSAMLV